MKNLEVKSYLVPFTRMPRPVFWFNDDFRAGTWSGEHCHPHWGELAYAGSGSIVVCTEHGNYLAPPNRAVWIPPGLDHEWYVPQEAKDRSLYISAECIPATERFSRFHMMEVTELVSKIIMHLAPLPYEYSPGPVARLVDVLLDQVVEMTEVPAMLSMPQDHRLIELCTTLLTSPDCQVSLQEWAQRLAMSERNLARLLYRQTGKCFRQWRQSVRMFHARNQLERGDSVTVAALDCGYTSVSSFIEAFKKSFGKTPGKLY